MKASRKTLVVIRAVGLLSAYLAYALAVVYTVSRINEQPPQWVGMAVLFIILLPAIPFMRRRKTKVEPKSTRYFFDISRNDYLRKALPLAIGILKNVILFFIIPVAILYLLEAKYGSLKDIPAKLQILIVVALLGCPILYRCFRRKSKSNGEHT